MKKMVTRADMVEAWRLSVGKVVELTNRDDFPEAYRAGKNLRWDESEVEEWWDAYATREPATHRKTTYLPKTGSPTAPEITFEPIGARKRRAAAKPKKHPRYKEIDLTTGRPPE